MPSAIPYMFRLLLLFMWIRFGKTVFKNIFLAADYSSAKVLICSRYMNRHISSIICIVRPVEFREGKIPHFGCTPNKLTINRFKFMDSDYSIPTMDTSTKNINFYPDNMYRKDAMYKYLSLHPDTHIRVKKVTKITGLIYTKSNMSL